jgi:hypothetical protein
MNKRPDYPDFNLDSVIEIDVSTALAKLRKLKVSFMRNESYIYYILKAQYGVLK